MIRQPTAFIEHNLVGGAVNLQHGQRCWNAAIFGLSECPAGETDDRCQAGNFLAGETVRHEPAVGVTDGEDLVECRIRVGFLNQRLDVSDIIRLSAEDVAAFGRGIPEAIANLVDGAVRQQ